MIRWMIRRDVETVVLLEKQNRFPWTEEDVLKSLRQRNCIGMVYELNQKVLGYMIYELHKTYIEILNLKVDNDHCNKNIGTEMVQSIIHKPSASYRKRICALISEGNLGAQLFFQKQNFSCTEIIKNNYINSDEDGYWFEYLIQTPHKYSPVNRISKILEGKNV